MAQRRRWRAASLFAACSAPPPLVQMHAHHVWYIVVLGKWLECKIRVDVRRINTMDPLRLRLGVPLPA